MRKSAGLVLAALIAVACKPAPKAEPFSAATPLAPVSSAPTAETVEQTHPAVKDSSSGTVLAKALGDLNPGSSPNAAATLRLGNSGPKPKAGHLPDFEFPVELLQEKRGTEEKLVLKSRGEIVETEVYETTATSFRLLAAGDDSFAPGLELVRFPAHAGDVWKWKGNLVYAGQARPATAQVTLSGNPNVVKVEVQLDIAADPDRPDLQRTLTFEFEPNKGVVRRSFGEVSSRRPAGEAWQP